MNFQMNKLKIDLNSNKNLLHKHALVQYSNTQLLLYDMLIIVEGFMSSCFMGYKILH